MSCTVQWRKVTCEGGSSPWPCQGKLWVSWCPRLLKNACMPMQVLGGGGESLGQSRLCTFKVVDAHKLVVSCSNIWSFLHLTVSADITDWCNPPSPAFQTFSSALPRGGHKSNSEVVEIHKVGKVHTDNSDDTRLAKIYIDIWGLMGFFATSEQAKKEMYWCLNRTDSWGCLPNFENWEKLH